jgi:hypothetical protein
MGTYTWSKEHRWANGLCTNTYEAETAVEIKGCSICLDPVDTTLVDEVLYLNAVDVLPVIPAGPRDIRGYGVSNYAYPRLGRDVSGGTIQHIAMRFEAVPVDQGNSLDSAILTLTGSGLAGGITADIKAMCNDVDDAGELPTLSTLTQWASLTQTTAKTTAVVPAHTTGDTFAIDITGSVNEVINRGSWAKDNNLIVLVEVQASGSTAWTCDIQYDTSTKPSLALVKA